MGRTDTESRGFMVTCLGDKLQSDLNVLAQEIVEDLEATLAHVARMEREWNPGWISWILILFIQTTS